MNEHEIRAVGGMNETTQRAELQHRVIHLDGVCRVALMVTPARSDSVSEETWDVVSTIRSILDNQAESMLVTKQAVFVRSLEDVEPIQEVFEAFYGPRMPATTFIIQPPCGGQSLAIEAWAIGGEGVEISFRGDNVVTINHNGLQWIYAGGICSSDDARYAYDESSSAFALLQRKLDTTGFSFQHVPRIWLYQGGITENETSEAGEPIERYRELNRARTDYFERLESVGQMRLSAEGKVCYPASTGIGTRGLGLAISFMGLKTERDDVIMRSLENPRQTSAFDYAKRFSVKSPKFSRAMAVKIGDYVTTWVSGTASILNSETVHKGDINKQTEQTIDNIAGLIGEANLAAHGLPGAGATLNDLAKVRVYVRRLEDFEECRSVCEKRLRGIPTIYAVADVCRPDLLVEIEGVAFTSGTDGVSRMQV